MSVPTPDHYYPFLFALGASHEGEARKMLIDWIDNGANGMTSFSFGIAKYEREILPDPAAVD